MRFVRVLYDRTPRDKCLGLLLLSFYRFRLMDRVANGHSVSGSRALL